MQKAVVSSSCLGATAILIILSSWSLGMEELALSDPGAHGG